MRLVAVLVAAVSFAGLARAACVGAQWPKGPDPNVRNTVYRVTLEMGASDKVLLATMAAAITESWVNNLPCGDKDSLGVFQQRPSQGWGSPAQLMDVEYSTRQFVKLCMSLEKTHPGIDAGVLAQLVQRAEAGNQYTKNEDLARQYLGLAAKAVGSSPPAPEPEPEPTKSTAAPKPPKTTAAPKPTPPKTTAAPKPPKSPASPKPKPTTVFPTNTPPPPAQTLPTPGVYTLYKPDGAPMTVLAAPSAAAARFDLPHAAEVVDTGVKTHAPKTKIAGCAKKVTPLVGESCASFAEREGIALDQLHAWNPRLDANCFNIDFSTAYCVEPASA
ncbi:hypothetical protein EXIGLDRAFT_835864 [Exidia glandulosa HHB12029]|uniref:LysM domain-containing protein n=1 Tax=Exidia glandulosa HHB12029 TaxID=1314781 RepID=A0A165ICU0_EXIGL|nr:hypothetical protein EXIGLDRAFT_835864 [Exidia glandulosa HHB12029]